MRTAGIIPVDPLGDRPSCFLKAGEIVLPTHSSLKYLPVYSPDLNPIEKLWSKMKAILRWIKAKTTEALDAAIKTVLDAVTPQDAIGWFTACGYES